MSDDLKGGEYYKELFDKLRNDPKFIFKYGMEQGELLERERIIKLLESIAITTKNDEVAVMELLSAIVELIKGENK